VQDRGIALPPDLMGPTVKQLQALIREHNATVKSVRKSPPVDLDAGSPDADVAPKKRAPKSSANVAPSAKVVPIAQAKAAQPLNLNAHHVRPLIANSHLAQTNGSGIVRARLV